MTGMELKKIREAHGLTQRELAKQIGMSEITISVYERGLRNPKPNIVKLLRMFFASKLAEKCPKRDCPMRDIYDTARIEGNA